MKSNWLLSQAAAGTGKTVELVRQYLSLLKAGATVERIVAITFTRKAAAELLERVSDVLYYLLNEPGPQFDRASRSVGSDFHELYGQYAPAQTERAKIQQALADLGAAPVGTVDSFVQKLLSEFALHAVFPVPGGPTVSLDYPIAAGGDPNSFLNEAARELMTPRDGNLPAEIPELLRHYDVTQLVNLIAEAPAHLVPESATAEEALQPLASQYATYLAAHIGGGSLGDSLVSTLALAPDAPLTWPEQLHGMSKKDGKPAAPAVACWLHAGALIETAPPELFALLGNLTKKSQAGRNWAELTSDWPAFYGRLQVGDSAVRLSDVALAKCLPGWQMASHDGRSDAGQTANRLRTILQELRQKVAARGWELAAQEGALDYEALLEAATTLCRQAPDDLRRRFDALLVDEVQDSSRAQIDFYLALADTNPDMRCFFVGDARQSIYLFRNADPTGIEHLAGLCDRKDLLANYRSIPALVEAHRQLFSPALNHSMDRSGYSELQDLTGLQSGKKSAPLKDETPVLLIRDLPVQETDEDGEVREVLSGPEFSGAQADRRALELFAERMAKVWEEWEAGGRLSPAPTAAVLAPVWRKATAARDILRARLGNDQDGSPRAYLDGGGRWLSGRVVHDVVLFLKALLDPGDQVAWLGVWKHPAVGLSDAALARIRAGKGICYEAGTPSDTEAPSWLQELGWVVKAHALSSPHEDADIRAFAHARSPLSAAREGLTRDGAAHTLDLLATRLGWRELLAVSPDDDSPAQFEMLLEWLRTFDFDGTDAQAMVDLLESDPNNADPPRLEVHRPDEHISCMTVYQAKGLQWDHVCVLSPGQAPSSQGKVNSNLTVMLDGEQRTLLGTRFDPNGAFEPKTDAVGKLARKIDGVRRNEECLRLAYVAITRARQSVVLALPNYELHGVQPQLQEVWMPGPNLSRVEFVQWQEASPVPPTPRAVVRAKENAHWMNLIPTPRFWLEETPSVLHAAMSAESRRELAEAIARKVQDEGEYVPKCFELVEAPVDNGLKEVTARDWGTLVHGWFEHWRFAGSVERSAVEQYLLSRWDETRAEVADFLVDVSMRLAAHPDSAFWKLVTEQGAKLHFEWPFVGPGPAAHTRGGDGRYLLTGSIDLLVQSADGRWYIIDFKAGSRYPKSLESVVREAHLKTYGPQLEGYRSAVDSALSSHEQKVEQVGLWFVRTGAGLLW